MSFIHAYLKLCAMVKAGAKRTWEAEHQTPYIVNGNQWYSFDDVESVQNKVNFNSEHKSVNRSINLSDNPK